MQHFKSKTCDHCDQIIIQIGVHWFIKHDEQHSNTPSAQPRPSGAFAVSENDASGSPIEDEATVYVEISAIEKCEIDEMAEIIAQSDSEENITSTMSNVETYAGAKIESDVGANAEEMATEMADKPHQCLFCRKIFANLQDSLLHVKNMHRNPIHPLSCILLFDGDTSGSNRSARAHGKRSKDKASGRETVSSSDRRRDKNISTVHLKHQCLICKVILSNLCNAYAHIRTKHKECTEFKSYVRLYNKDLANPLTDYVRRRHPSKQVDGIEVKYQCVICNRIANQSSNAYKHVRVMHKSHNPYKSVRKLSGRDGGKLATRFEKRRSSGRIKNANLKRASADPIADSAVDASGDIYRCLICRKLSKSFIDSATHVKEQHFIIKNYENLVETISGAPEIFSGETDEDLKAKTIDKLEGTGRQQEFQEKQMLECHLETRQNTSERPTEIGEYRLPHQCLICEKVLKNLWTSYAHVQNEHKNCADFERYVRMCEDTVNLDVEREAYSLLRSRIKPKEKAKTLQTKWLCTVCKRISNQSSNAYKHARLQHRIRDPSRSVRKIYKEVSSEAGPECRSALRKENKFRTNRDRFAQPHQCKVCDKILCDLWNSYAHVKSQHREQVDFKSHVCPHADDSWRVDAQYDERYTVRRQLKCSKKVRDGPTWQCVVCNRIFNQSSNAYSHVRSLHKDHDPLKSVKKLFNEHILVSESNGPEEGDRAIFLDDMMTYTIDVDDELDSSDIDSPHQCLVCDEILSDFNESQNHVKQAHFINGGCENFVRVFAQNAAFTEGDEEQSSQVSSQEITQIDSIEALNVDEDEGRDESVEIHEQLEIGEAVNEVPEAFPPNLMPHQCMICNKILSTLGNAYQHVKLLHKNRLDYKSCVRIVKIVKIIPLKDVMNLTILKDSSTV